MREKTVVALYDRFGDATAAVGDLIQAGIARDTVALLANTSTGDHPPLTINPAFAGEEFETDSGEQSALVTGAEVGIGVGGILGFLLGISSLSIPGLTVITDHGTWATVAAGAALGGIVGAVIGSLTSHGVTDTDTKLYAEGLKRGGTLVTVGPVAETQVASVTAAFRKHGAVDVQDRVAPWNPEGWVGFDEGHWLTSHGEVQPHAA